VPAKARRSYGRPGRGRARGDFSRQLLEPSLLPLKTAGPDYLPAADNLTTSAYASLRQRIRSSAAANHIPSIQEASSPTACLACPVGDAFEGVFRHNFSESEAMSYSDQGFSIQMNDQQPERQFRSVRKSQEVLYAFEAIARYRFLSFRARMAMRRRLEVGIPAAAAPTETVALAGETRSGRGDILSDDIYPENSMIEVQAASSALWA